jgi:hypothetical protein
MKNVKYLGTGCDLAQAENRVLTKHTDRRGRVTYTIYLDTEKPLMGLKKTFKAKDDDFALEVFGLLNEETEKRGGLPDDRR